MSQLVPDPLIEDVAQRFRMLAEPARLVILNHLSLRGEMNVQELVAASGQRQSSVSKHLAQLADAGILARRREGQNVYYRVVDPTISAMCLLVCGRLRTDEHTGPRAITPAP